MNVLEAELAAVRAEYESLQKRQSELLTRMVELNEQLAPKLTERVYKSVYYGFPFEFDHSPNAEHQTALYESEAEAWRNFWAAKNAGVSLRRVIYMQQVDVYRLQGAEKLTKWEDPKYHFEKTFPDYVHQHSGFMAIRISAEPDEFKAIRIIANRK